MKPLLKTEALEIRTATAQLVQPLSIALYPGRVLTIIGETGSVRACSHRVSSVICRRVYTPVGGSSLALASVKKGAPAGAGRYGAVTSRCCRRSLG